MTKEEIKQQKKATALNAIRKIYHIKSITKMIDNASNSVEDYSYSEQRDSMVRDIIEKLEKELKELK